MNTIPKNLSKFFWDTRFSDINPDTNKDYVIGRLLRQGDEQAWKWLKEKYSTNQIIHVVKNNRELTSKDATFFSLIFNLNLMELRCINRA